jgi:hypothetical protein
VSQQLLLIFNDGQVAETARNEKGMKKVPGTFQSFGTFEVFVDD